MIHTHRNYGAKGEAHRSYKINTQLLRRTLTNIDHMMSHSEALTRLRAGKMGKQHRIK